MPKVKQLDKYKHPNSRKTKALAKQLKKQSLKEKAKLSTNIKQNILGEKFLWFRDHMNSEQECCSLSDIEELILNYLGRFDEELEQIKIKHSIGHRKNRQHANREDIINMTLKREREEFKTCGIEIPDLTNETQKRLLQNWTGELRYLQNFKLKRFSIQNLRDNKKVQMKTDRDCTNKGLDINNKVINVENVKQNSNKDVKENSERPNVDSMDVDS